jgi:hypothetical protein
MALGMPMKNYMTRPKYISQISAAVGIWFLGLVLITGIITNSLTNAPWLMALGFVLVLDAALVVANLRTRGAAPVMSVIRRRTIAVMSIVAGTWFTGLVVYLGVWTNSLTDVSWLEALGAVLLLDAAFFWINFNLYRRN